MAGYTYKLYRYIIYNIVSVAVLTTQIQAQSKVDTLRQNLEKSPPDSNKVNQLIAIANYYFFKNLDSALHYSGEALELATGIKYYNGMMGSLIRVGEMNRLKGNYPAAMKNLFQALTLSRKIKTRFGEAISMGFIGATYSDLRQYNLAFEYLLPANNIHQTLPPDAPIIFNLTNIAHTYERVNKPDSALLYMREAYDRIQKIKHPSLRTLVFMRFGDIYNNKGDHDSTLYYYHRGLSNSLATKENLNSSKVKIRLALLHESINHYDSTMHYAREGYLDAQMSLQQSEMLAGATLLVKMYRKKNKLDSAFLYEDVVVALRDTIYGPERFKQVQLLMLDEQRNQQKILMDQENYRDKIKYTILISAVGILMLLGFILIRNNRHKQKAKDRVEHAYTELKNTQAQLIQREKMASLGELTAGIAHEIQNPLNFVNNFSDVNTELIDELKSELATGNVQLANEIANDIKDNEQKINQHGKRADGIVKNMLQHSNISSGKKEPTDINALADEYLRLSYHGLRAKDKSFNASFKTDFDNSIGKLYIIPQDIGRVILNLINNAFYTVSEKKKQNLAGYEPTVIISTKKANGKVEIKVHDNGNGIPQKVLDKIFQPFFTTKPTGQGTGLGLSLSYDIVTKGHGGELKVETKEREGSEFVIQLPT